MQPSDLVYWINERERVRKKKEKGLPKPWSEDEIFWHTYFTNVRREDDNVTKWLEANWRTNHGHLPFYTSSLVLARMFNLPDHLEELKDWWRAPRVAPWMKKAVARSKERRELGFPCFNGAYLITTCGVKMDKIDYVYRVVGDTWDLTKAKLRQKPPMTLAEYHKELTRINGLGSFLAAQVIADLKNTLGHPLQNARDWFTWCAPGPGSLRGIKTIDGYSNTSEGEFLAAATALYKSVESDLECGPIHMQDFQNCLCEFSKYVRVSNGGRSKRGYPGGPT